MHPPFPAAHSVCLCLCLDINITMLKVSIQVCLFSPTNMQTRQYIYIYRDTG
jgi:hypothetical protein